MAIGCGDDEPAATADTAQTVERAATVPIDATVDVAEANVAIAKYCVAALEGVPSDDATDGFLLGIDRITDAFRQNPDATIALGDETVTMRQYVLDVIGTVENGDCSPQHARQLERELENAP